MVTSSTPPPENPDHNAEEEGSLPQRQLRPEDQQKVDEFLRRGVNSVERKPFRPLWLILLLIGTVTLLSLLSQGLALWAGVY